ncbi:Flp family type IVb pilin [Euzebya tangerina]|uniref:Flp family type IVb pilin n=1 Tax=Euzebya tangerina TaxID=591198 RepID=UPI000E31D94D|nr:Flp family type IVb pilin [Euzebya tangerina]
MNAVINLYLTTLSLVDGLRDRLADEEGQTTMEWLGIAAVLVAILVAFAGLGGDIADFLRATFERLVNTITGA